MFAQSQLKIPQVKQNLKKESWTSGTLEYLQLWSSEFQWLAFLTIVWTKCQCHPPCPMVQSPVLVSLLLFIWYCVPRMKWEVSGWYADTLLTLTDMRMFRYYGGVIWWAYLTWSPLHSPHDCSYNEDASCTNQTLHYVDYWHQCFDNWSNISPHRIFNGKEKGMWE